MQQVIQKAITKTGLSLLLSVFSYVSLTHAGTPFTTDGNFSVGNDGSANYSIPIQVPPGTAGMAPTLSLNYNSNGGNGMLGMGWGIDGLSQISRCPQTLVQDGQIRGVKYDANDKLCLDGQRLISTGGTYGANGTEYRTEKANFARIISYTSDINNGPDSFKVWTKAGQVIEYGNTADSRIEAAGKTVIRSWATNKISDTKGNYISVSYTEDNANGEAYVNRIDYTGNSNTGLAPYANVQFEYEDRPDISIAYQAGSIIKSTKRMTNIKTYTNNTTLVKDYRLTYEQGTATQRSRLKTLTECDGGGSSMCRKPTTVEWQEGTSDFTNSYWVGHGGGYANNFLGDFNGDGLTDLAAYAGGTNWHISLSTGSGFTNSYWVGHGGGYANNFLGDFNGDGLTDLAAYAGGTNWHISLSTGSGFTNSYWVGHGGGYANNFLGDFNGDGLTDLAAYAGGTNWHISLSTGSGFTNSYWVGHGGGYANNFLGDFNGDGLTDLAAYAGGTNWHISLSTGSGFTNSYWVGHGGGYANNFLGDFNGDGLTDLAAYAGGTNWHISLSTGSGFTNSYWVGHGGGYANNFLGDFNGDGLTDLAAYAGGTNWHISMSTGSGFTNSYWVGHGGGADNNFLGDFNGDGKDDLSAFAGGTSWHIALSAGNFPDQLTTLMPGLSSNISLAYRPLTDKAIYAKGVIGEAGTTECPQPTGDVGTSNSYPIVNLQAPMYVVSSASVSDGNSGTLTNTYQYGGLKAHVKGRGSLGFRYQQVTQTDADINSTTFFRQDYPYIGLPCQTEKRVTSTSTLIGASALSYANAPKSEGSATSQFPYLTQSVEQSFELDGSLINTTTKTNQFDDYGNATQIGVDSGDGYTKTTNNECYNDTSNGKWLLGRLLRSTVTSTSPDTAPTLPGGGGGTTTPPPTSTSWTHCANEWSWCGFWGETKTVRFGVGNQWVEGSFTDGVNCNGGSFGGVDPAPGTAKTCEIADTTTTPPPAANASPTISLVAGSSTATQGDNISLTATASDSDGTITQVTFYDGANLIGTDSSAPYSLTWTTDTNTTTGTHNLTAKATDDGGAEGNSGVVAVTLNAATPLPPANVAPSVSITNPPNGISVPGPIDVQITADASDSDGTIAEVAFYANGNLLGTDTTAPYAVDVTGVQAGNYTVTATATDDDGATTSASVQVTVN